MYEDHLGARVELVGDALVGCDSSVCAAVTSQLGSVQSVLRTIHLISITTTCDHTCLTHRSQICRAKRNYSMYSSITYQHVCIKIIYYLIINHGIFFVIINNVFRIIIKDIFCVNINNVFPNISIASSASLSLTFSL